MKNRLPTYQLKIFLLFFTLVKTIGVEAQQTQIDSLILVCKGAKPDSAGAFVRLKLAAAYSKNANQDSAIAVSSRALAIGKKLHSPLIIGSALNNMSWYNYEKGEAAKSLEQGNQAVKIWDSLASDPNAFKDSMINRARSSTFGNLGTIYRNQGNAPKALECLIKAIKITELLNDQDQTARHLGNIGLIYSDQKDYDKALQYYFKALKIDEKSKDKNGLSFRLTNIGIVYFEMKNYAKSLNYYIRGLKLSEQMGDQRKIARNLGNIGNIYLMEERYDIAFNYYSKALKINEEINSRNGITIQLGNIGSLLLKEKKYREAEPYLLRALDIDTTIGFMKHAEDTYKNLEQLYTSVGDHKKAFQYYTSYITVRDSLFNADQINEITRQEMNYQFEKKEAEAKAEQDKKDAIAKEEKKRQQIIVYAISFGILLVLILSGVILRSLRTNKKKNRIISAQKREVEEKQLEILDSIRYAKRIQSSLLPTEIYIHKSLKRLNK